MSALPLPGRALLHSQTKIHFVGGAYVTRHQPASCQDGQYRNVGIRTRRYSMTSTTPQKKPEYLSQSRIKSEFGLTDTQIRSLGEPDTTRPNPHYRSGPPMKLYL